MMLERWQCVVLQMLKIDICYYRLCQWSSCPHEVTPFEERDIVDKLLYFNIICQWYRGKIVA